MKKEKFDSAESAAAASLGDSTLGEIFTRRAQRYRSESFQKVLAYLEETNPASAARLNKIVRHTIRTVFMMDQASNSSDN